VATAAIAACARHSGLGVAVVKPAQTGTADDIEPDIAVIARLAGPTKVLTLADYPDPLAPLAAARVSGRPALTLDDVAEQVRRLADDLVLVEGAGGLLVPMGADGWTAADLAAALTAPVVVVVRAGLGTLNHTALTLEALARRRLRARVVIGAWPRTVELVHRTNLCDLPGDLAGAIPEGVAVWEPSRFRERAPEWLTPVLHGRFDAEAFRGAGGR
jgi:dethiobiotin synthetase